MVGDSEFHRGAFEEAAVIYQRAATLSLDHDRLWLRPLVGQVQALLKAVRVDEAQMMARHACDLARKKMADFNEQVSSANQLLASQGRVSVSLLPPRESVVATRMGSIFLREGEPALAREFFEKALLVNPGGACRARQGLARIALAMNDPARALTLAEESIRGGRYAAKTLAAWPLLIAARRRLGGWQISQNLLNGLDMAPPGVRARAVLAITRELRNGDMRQWREVAQKWSTREGKRFPIVEAELRKMILASARAAPGDAEAKRKLAEELLKTPGLSRNEWLAAAKECIRAGLWEGRRPNLDALIRHADAQYGGDSGPRTAHSLAISCMMAKRHDLARPLLQRNIANLPAGKSLWGKSVWALARMESLLGNHMVAAGWYRTFCEADSIPIRFRLQAQLLWMNALMAAGKPEALIEARPAIERLLAAVQDPEVLLDFARQLYSVSPQLYSWSFQLFEQGERLALANFAAAQQPAVASEILFKLTRRQVNDFNRAGRAIDFWEKLPAEKKEWLWSSQACFWEYLGWLAEAYGRQGGAGAAEVFARTWLDDPATPPEGAVCVGIPYVKWLVGRCRADEALALCDRLVEEAPTHRSCAWAWYWKALKARKQGDAVEAKRCASAIRRAQGVDRRLQPEWKLEARALLLLADLDPRRVDAQAVNYAPADWEAECSRLRLDMDRLP